MAGNVLHIAEGGEYEALTFKIVLMFNRSKIVHFSTTPPLLAICCVCRFPSQFNNQMEIKLRNDGKQKAQSCEAEIELSSKNHAWGHFRAEFSGYGANDWSAKMNLIQQVDGLIVELQKLKDSVT